MRLIFLMVFWVVLSSIWCAVSFADPEAPADVNTIAAVSVYTVRDVAINSGEFHKDWLETNKDLSSAKTYPQPDLDRAELKNQLLIYCQENWYYLNSSNLVSTKNYEPAPASVTRWAKAGQQRQIIWRYIYPKLSATTNIPGVVSQQSSNFIPLPDSSSITSGNKGNTYLFEAPGAVGDYRLVGWEGVAGNLGSGGTLPAGLDGSVTTGPLTSPDTTIKWIYKLPIEITVEGLPASLKSGEEFGTHFRLYNKAFSSQPPKFVGSYVLLEKKDGFGQLNGVVDADVLSISNVTELSRITLVYGPLLNVTAEAGENEGTVPYSSDFRMTRSDNTIEDYYPGPYTLDLSWENQVGELQIRAPKVVLDWPNSRWYKLRGFESTGTGAGKDLPATKEIVVDTRVTPDYWGATYILPAQRDITWFYDKAYKLTVKVEGVDGSAGAQLCVAGDCRTITDMAVDYYFKAGTQIELSTPITAGGSNFTDFIFDVGSSGTVVDEPSRKKQTFSLSENTSVVLKYGTAHKWVVGQHVSPPDNDVNNEPIDEDINPFKNGSIKILSPAGVSAAEAFDWDPRAKKLVPLRVLTSVEITWGTAAPVPGYALYPMEKQTCIVEAPVNLAPPGLDYDFAGVAFSGGGEGDAYDLSDLTRFKVLLPGTLVLRYREKMLGDSTALGYRYVILDAKRWEDKADPDPIGIDIGGAISDPDHSDPEGKNGYVYYQNSFYDSDAYKRGERQGPILPVNASLEDLGSYSSNYLKQMVVVWYEEETLDKVIEGDPPKVGIGWPTRPIRYTVSWPMTATVLPILGTGWPYLPIGYTVSWSATAELPIAAPLPLNDGSPGYPEARVYVQDNPEDPGFNPNEEHALINSDNLYALRSNLNAEHNHSAPWVLLKYKQGGEWAMKPFKVTAGDFTGSATVGNALVSPFPLDAAKESKNPDMTDDPYYFQDIGEGHWAKAAAVGNEAPAEITMHWYYPLLKDFFYPDYDGDGTADVSESAPVAFQDEGKDPADDPTDYVYTVAWPETDPPVGPVAEYSELPLGGSITDKPFDLFNWKSGEIIFDEGVYKGQGPLAKLYAPMVAISYGDRAGEDIDSLPAAIAAQAVKTEITKWTFPTLPYALRERLSYDAQNGILKFSGAYMGPPGDTWRLPNLMTAAERDYLTTSDSENVFTRDVDTTDVWDAWGIAVDELYKRARNPGDIDMVDMVELSGPTNPFPGYSGGDFSPDDWSGAWTIGLGLQRIKGENEGEFKVKEASLVNVKMALTAGMASATGWVVLVENNHEDADGGTVGLKVVHVGPSVYRGEIKVLESTNPFDERLTLHYLGDFGGEPERFWFQWYSKADVEGAGDSLSTGAPDSSWEPYPDGKGYGLTDITIAGASQFTLSDNWFVARYNYAGSFGKPLNPPLDPLPDPLWSEDSPPDATRGDWSDTVGAPVGSPGQVKPMLAEGWVKRVLADINPLDTRVKNFRNNATNTKVDIIAQLGERYEGDIAFNADAEHLNNLGLIEAYETILRRARRFSIDADNALRNDPTDNALILVASKLATFYRLLGNEAYADAIDPTVGFDTVSAEFGPLAPSIFAFKNQLSSLLDEELSLLRGRDDQAADPIYNRLSWNFTRGDGEVAYVMNYNLGDTDVSGGIDEGDARIMFPQGHGDAWGHYLMGMKYYYDLLGNPLFKWQKRSESVTVAGSAVEVDYLDERNFATIAAAKAKVGAEIVDLTYRQGFVADPAGQWQGYKDTDTERAWGVDGWARRAGQGAYFDWLLANALLPAIDPVSSHEGIQKIDRTTVAELSTLASQFRQIQSRLDQADQGLNPLGLAEGVVPFDIDPSLIEQGQTHFEQIYARAAAAMGNAVTVFNHANQFTQRMRDNQDSRDDFQDNLEAQERDLRNRLIEIYGYPYVDDCKPGGDNDGNCDGPDLIHFMIAERPDLADQGLREIVTYKAELSSAQIACLDNDDVFDSNDCNAWDIGNDTPREVTFNFEADNLWPIKPATWSGVRKAPGEIQLALSDIIQGHAALQLGIAAFDAAVDTIENGKELLEVKYNITQTTIVAVASRNSEIQSLAEKVVDYRSYARNYRAAAKVADAVAKAAVEGIPKVTGTSNDTTSGLRSGVKTAAIVTSKALNFQARRDDKKADLFEADGAAVERKFQIELLTQNNRYEVEELKTELEEKINNATLKKIELYSLKETLNLAIGRYHAVLARGSRLLDEREELRRQAAGDVQDYRYQDLGFRIFRNDALQKYRAQFDLAARYVYLAAKAYDYETNLLGSDNGAGARFLTDIVKQRSLGEILDGEPMPGTQGLADPLARMGHNFSVYKTQLGFNNPQTETNRFSLRSELFRLGSESDESWREKLASLMVDDLWQDEDFRRYLRPFAPRSAGVQPALVIPFSSMVQYGRNFFGWPLSGGDSAYDPSHFATKIRSAGLWFKDYNAAGLSNTPRIYLVPVGLDVLRSPSGDGFALRKWKVVDQVLPVPFPIGGDALNSEAWIPVNDTLSNDFGGIRRHSSLRAYHVGDDSGAPNLTEMSFDSRLIGRSVWNTRWKLVIPGATLLSDPKLGLKRFIDTVNDIQLFFQTYSYSGN